MCVKLVWTAGGHHAHRNCLRNRGMIAMTIWVVGWVQQVEMDVIKLPDDYSALMLSICTAAPRRIIFFLKGALQVTTLRKQHFSLQQSCGKLVDCT